MEGFLKGFLVFCILIFQTLSVFAEGEENDGEKYFEEGVRYFENKRYVEAIDKFLQSYDTFAKAGKNTPEILYNIAICYERLGKFQVAISYYQQFLREKEQIGISIEERQAIVKRIERLRKIEGKIEPQEQIEPTIVTQLYSLEGRVKELEIKARKKIFWDVMRPAYLFWITGGITLPVGVAYGIKWKLEKNEIDRASTQLEAHPHAKNAKKYATIADIIYAIAGVSILSGTIWFFIDLKKKGKERKISLIPSFNSFELVLNF